MGFCIHLQNLFLGILSQHFFFVEFSLLNVFFFVFAFVLSKGETDKLSLVTSRLKKRIG